MRTGFWIRLSAFAFLSAVAITVPATAAAASETEPAETPQGCSVHGSVELCLTDPPGAEDGRDRLVEERLSEITKSAKDGDSIRGSMYTWTRPALAEELVAAKDRGVDVKIVLDGVNKADNNDGYKTLNDGGVPLTNCDNSCLGSNINHTKYFLFEIGDTKSVVLTSSNLTTAQTELYNNLLKVDGDAKLYDFYIGFWERMNAESWTFDGVTWDDEDKVVTGDSGAAGYVYPR